MNDLVAWLVEDQVAGVEFLLELPTSCTEETTIIVQRVETREIVARVYPGRTVVLSQAGTYWLRAKPMLQSLPFAVVAGKAARLCVTPKNWPIARGSPRIELVDTCGNSVTGTATVIAYLSEGEHVHEIRRVPMAGGRADFVDLLEDFLHILADNEYAISYFEATMQESNLKIESTPVTFARREVHQFPSAVNAFTSTEEVMAQLYLERRRGALLAEIATRNEKKALAAETKLQQITCAGRLRVDNLLKRQRKNAVKALRDAILAETIKIQRLEADLSKCGPLSHQESFNTPDTLYTRDNKERSIFFTSTNLLSIPTYLHRDIDTLESQRQEALREYLVNKQDTSTRVANLRAAIAELASHGQTNLRRLNSDHRKLLPTRYALLQSLHVVKETSIPILDSLVLRLNTKWRLSSIHNSLQHQLAHFNQCSNVEQLGLSTQRFPLIMDPRLRLPSIGEGIGNWIEFWAEPSIDPSEQKLHARFVYHDPYCALLFFHFLAQRERLVIDESKGDNDLTLHLIKLDVHCTLFFLPLQSARLDTLRDFLQRRYIDVSLPLDAEPTDLLPSSKNRNSDSCDKYHLWWPSTTRQ